MRLGEIVTAAVLAVLSIYMMWMSTKLNIGYVDGRGPGGGAWPFWLSAIMLLCTVLIAIKWVRRTSPPSQSNEPVLDAEGRKTVALVAAGLIGFVGLTSIVSMYGAMALFLIYYLWFLGRHSVWFTALMAFGVPAFFFFFFEGVMRVTLPKGMRFTDPFFNPLYDLIY